MFALQNGHGHRKHGLGNFASPQKDIASQNRNLEENREVDR